MHAPSRGRRARLALGALLLTGCGGDPAAPEDDNAGLPRTATLEPWQSLTLVPSLGKARRRWTVSDPDVAYLAESPSQGCSILWCDVPEGLQAYVHGLAPGLVMVQVSTLDEPARTAAVAVTVRGAPMAAFRLEPAALTLAARVGTASGGQAPLQAVILDSTGRTIPRRVRWTSSDPTVVTGFPTAGTDGLCCERGFLAFAGRAGTATVTATVEGRQASAVVQVTP